MVRKKKNTFDNRDALEILRDAFGGTETPIVAELGTRAMKARTVADKYREEITPEDLFKQRKEAGLKRQAGKAKKSNPYNSFGEETGELPTFWNEKTELQEPAKEKQKKPAPTLVEMPAVPLSEQSPTPQPPLKLSLEEHKIFEKIRGTYEKKIESAEANDLTRWENEGGAVPKEKIEPPHTEALPSPSIPKQPSKAEDPLKAERAEQVKQFLAEKEAEIYHSNIPEIEKRIQYLYDNKTKEGKPDFEAIDRLQRAIEIAKATNPTPPTEPLSSQTPDISTVEKQLEQNIAKVQGQPETRIDLGTPTVEEFEKPTKPAKKEKERIETGKKFASNLHPEKEARLLNTEDLPKTAGEASKTEPHFEERITKLEKRINETGGTPEERQKHWALQKAKEHHYSVSEINNRIDELKKEPAGMHAMEIQMLMEALNILKPESPAKEPTIKTETAPTPRTPETKPETTPVNADKTFEEFGISKEDLARVEGFNTLNDNQKAFIFENLRRVLYADIETRAKTLLAEETSKQSGLRRTGRKTFEGFAGQGGKLMVKEAEALKAIRTGGIVAHGETLKLLVNLIDREEVKLNPDTGILEVSYINPDMFGTEYKKEIEQYNAAAQHFAGIPETWSYPSASKKNRRECQTARAQYEEQRNNVLKYVFAKTNDNASAWQFMLERDSQVAMQRVFSAYPQLETVLKNVKQVEEQDHGIAATRSTIKESGWKAGIAGLSSFARYNAITVLGYSATEAAIGIGGIVNGARETWRAQIKAREELETARQDLTRKEKSVLKLKGGRALLGIGKKEYLRAAGHAFRKTTMIDASDYAERMDNLILKIKDPAGNAETKKRSEKHLFRLVRMAEAHIEEGLINFGKGGSRLTAAYEFTNKLSNARVELARKDFFTDVNKEFGEKLKQKVEKFMDKKTERMSAEEKKFVLRGLTRGVMVGAVAGGVGAAFGGWLKDRFGDDIQKWIGSVREKTSLGGKTVAAPKNLPISSKVSPDTGEVMTPQQLETAQRAYQGLGEPGTGDSTVKRTGEIRSGAGDSTVKMESSADFPGITETLPSEPVSHTIGKRGPEGTIIDEFKNNPNLARQFGWDGKGNISGWAGAGDEAHRVWLRHAQEAIKDPALIEQMKKLGYLRGLSKESLGDENIILGRYTEMMHHIKKGSSLLFNAKEKSLDFSKVTFLKARH